MDHSHIEERLHAGETVVLDCGFGTELARHGVPGVHDPHIWSLRGLMNAPEVGLCVHLENVLAGADVITPGAFRSNPTAVRHAGMEGTSRALTHYAVRIAQQVFTELGRALNVAVAANLTSVSDCYEPGLSPGWHAFEEHREKAKYLLECKPDLLLIESMPNVEEAAAALSAAKKEGAEAVWVSLVVDPESRVPMILDGTKIADLWSRLVELARCEPSAVLLNCAPPEAITDAMPVLRDSVPSAVPVGAYANAERPDKEGCPWVRREDVTPQRYADFVSRWVADGAAIVGGCCGTTPRDIRAIRERLPRELPRGSDDPLACHWLGRRIELPAAS